MFSMAGQYLDSLSQTLAETDRILRKLEVKMKISTEKKMKIHKKARCPDLFQQT